MKILGFWWRFLAPIRFYGGGGGTSQEFDATRLFGSIARDQWDDYKARFQPVQMELSRMTNGATLPQALGDATKSVNTAFDTQRQSNALALSRRGVKPTAEQQGVMARSMDASKASALGAAQNSARMHTFDRDRAVMSGGLSTLNRQIKMAA